MTPVEYAALVESSHGSQRQRQRRTCKRLVNGLGPDATHCQVCQARLYRIAAERERHEYRVRDYAGRVISDWLL